MQGQLRRLRPANRSVNGRGLTSLVSAICQRGSSADGASWSAARRMRDASEGSVNAFVSRSDSASPAAGGPLAGAPLAVKDNICVEGLPCTAASKILEGWESPYSATAVTRLEAAGAVVVGKANMDEFGMGSGTSHSTHGSTVNPSSPGIAPGDEGAAFTLPLTAGGSSGGSAAAVAVGSAAVALGSDTGGSVRQPASMCGVVGLKPTYGRISRFGLISYASSLDTIGILAPTVADAALALDASAGQDGRDDTCIRAEPVSMASLQESAQEIEQVMADHSLLDRPLSSGEQVALTGALVASGPGSEAPFGAPVARAFHRGLLAGPALAASGSRAVPAASRVEGMRVCLPTSLLNLPGVRSQVRSATLAAAEALAAAGAEVVEVSEALPQALIEQAVGAYYVLASAEAASNLSRYDGVRYGHRTDWRPADPTGGDAGASFSEPGAETGSIPPLEELMERSRTEGFGTEVRRRIMVGNFALSASVQERYYARASAVRMAVRKQLLRLLYDGSGFHAALFPTSPVPAWPLGDMDRVGADTVYALDALTLPASLAGLPALSVPGPWQEFPVDQLRLGDTATTAGDAEHTVSLPVGVQLVGRPLREDQVLRLGAAVEVGCGGVWQAQAKAVREPARWGTPQDA